MPNLLTLAKSATNVQTKRRVISKLYLFQVSKIIIKIKINHKDRKERYSNQEKEQAQGFLLV